MKPKILFRRVHYWLAIVVALPFVVVLITGLLLHAKKWVPWVQPTELRGGSGAPTISFDQMLDSARLIPEAAVDSWDDIIRIDMRPSRGLVKITAHNRWEIQLNAATGEVMQVAYRRSDVIEAIHDGSWFGAIVRYGIFIPAGILLVVIWGTGTYLFFLPFWLRRRSRRARMRYSRRRTAVSSL